MEDLLQSLNNPAIIDFYNSIENWFANLFVNWGMSSGDASMVAMIVMIVLSIVAVLLAFYLVYKLIKWAIIWFSRMIRAICLWHRNKKRNPTVFAAPGVEERAVSTPKPESDVAVSAEEKAELERLNERFLLLKTRIVELAEQE